VRKIFGTELATLNAFYPELGRTLGEEFLEPHRCYYRMLKPLLPQIKGIAHITGGGLIDNIPRILPRGLAAKLDRSSWKVPPIFSLIQKKGNIDEQEMYRVFNMGIGMAIFCSPCNIDNLLASLPEAKIIGEAVEGEGVIIN
jgi:phosphoribosylformylglycinamidine cyclo-ligase